MGSLLIKIYILPSNRATKLLLTLMTEHNTAASEMVRVGTHDNSYAVSYLSYVGIITLEELAWFCDMKHKARHCSVLI